MVKQQFSFGVRNIKLNDQITIGTVAVQVRIEMPPETMLAMQAASKELLKPFIEPLLTALKANNSAFEIHARH